MFASRRLTRSKTLRRALLVMIPLAIVVAAAAILDALYPPKLDRYLDRSALVLDDEGRILRAYTASDGRWRLPVDVSAVSPRYIEMLIAYEDQRFRWHPGVDPLAVARAVGQAVVHRRIVSGASTLTMQTVRLLEPRPRTVGSKLVEMARALQLEWHLTKDEILSIYLTLAPFGGNLEGVRAAALAYIDREPDRLSPGEAALLVALPQAPERARPDRAPEAARAARDKVLTRMAATGVLASGEADEATQEAIPNRRRPMPFLAAHLADRLVTDAPGQLEHHTTIDGALQRAVEHLARQAVLPLDDDANLAIIVADHCRRVVTAYAGSADFFADRRSGQIDFVRAVRSPGSALKPFIYGIGFEDRVIHPETVIEDVPRRFGDYAPTNFDPVFSGDVTVREALIRSLNIPAVAVLERVGPARLAARLRSAGAPLRFYDEETGPTLPIALGGVGTTLFDLATAYAALADGGEAAPLRLTEDAAGLAADPVTAHSGPRLMAPMAAWYVTSILADIPPPSARLDPVYARAGRRIAYKTGTSYGFRDAWAVGYDARHTVAIWAGRPDGTPSPQRYGRNTAAPLLFRVFELLPTPAADVVTTPPAEVILAGNADLPPRLRYFDRSPLDAPIATGQLVEPDLRIDFPINGSIIDLAGTGQNPEAFGTYDSLPLIALGGRRPLRWLVNGRPVAGSALSRQAEWQPDGSGAVRISVIDETGRSDNVEVWVR